MLALLVLLASSAPAKRAAPHPPTGIAGTWDVERAAVDAQDASHWQYRPDDPQLVGRTLVIEAEGVRFDRGKRINCVQSIWRPRPSTWGILIGKGFPRPQDAGRGARPTPEDFDIKQPKDKPAVAYSLCPREGGGKSAPAFPSDTWVATLDVDRIALHYTPQVLLILRRRPKDAKPVASFDCEKAASPTERAICASFDLASWDRSVAAAWRAAIGRTPEGKADLVKSEKQWLAKRDACDDKADCIYEQLWGRVDELSQE